MGSRTIRARFKVNGVLTDPTTAKLSDADGTYGVKRDDTDAVVVADGTDMTQESAGIYSYTFDSVEGVAYTGWAEFVYGGNTYRREYQFAAASSSTSADLTVTYGSLRREIGRFLGYGRDPSEWESSSEEYIDVEDVLKSGIRKVLNPPPLPREKYAHEWSFLRPNDSFSTVAPYTTGTVEVVDGVVTLTGGTWPSWAIQGHLTIESGTYSVATRSGDTEIILDDTTVDANAATTFSLGRTVYDMPDDFMDIEGRLTYATGQSLLRSVVVRIAVQQVLKELTYTYSSGYPRKFAIRPKAIDMTAATKYEMLLCPTPDAAYTFNYRYRIAIPGLDESNTTPPGGDAYGELYLEACLAAAEQKLHDTGDLHSARFTECLAAAVSHDRQVACPDTLGINHDYSDGPAFDSEDHLFTNTGLTRYDGYPP